MTHTLEAEVPLQGAGQRVDLFVTQTLGLFPRSQFITRGCRVFQGSKELKPGQKLKGSETLKVEYQDLPEASYQGEELPLDILYEDSRVIVVNKARGMVVHPAQGNHSGTLVQGLLFHCQGLAQSFPEQKLRPGIVHRLDKDTTGVLIAAKNPQVLEYLGSQFRKKTTRKIYLAVVKGRPPRAQGEIDNIMGRDPGNRKRFSCKVLGGKRAVTLFRILEQAGDYTLVELSPLTGRTHQLRVHMAFLGCPILGDPIYAQKDRRHPGAPLMLHAASLKISLEEGEDPQIFRGSLPGDFLSTLRTLGMSSGVSVH